MHEKMCKGTWSACSPDECTLAFHNGQPRDIANQCVYRTPLAVEPMEHEEEPPMQSEVEAAKVSSSDAKDEVTENERRARLAL